MLLQHLEACMLPPKPEMETLSRAIAGVTHDPNSHGLSKDPEERPESGHWNQGPAKKQFGVLERLCNPCDCLCDIEYRSMVLFFI